MKNKKIVSAIAILLALLMAFSLILSVLPIAAHADADMDARLEALKQKKEQLASMRQDAEEKLAELREQQAAVIELKLTLEERNTAALEELDAIADEIDYYNELIESKADEVEEARKLEEKQLQRYRVRIRAMEESGGFNILDIILRADSLGELLTAIEDAGLIMKKDRELEIEYMNARANHENIKAEYEATKLELEDKKLELEDEKLEIAAQVEDSQNLIDDLAKDIEKTEAEQRAAAEAEAAASAGILAFINSYNQQKAEEAAKQEAANNQPAVTPGNTDQGSTEGGEASEGGESSEGEGSVEGAPSEQPPASEPAPAPEPAPQQPSVNGTYMWPVPSSHRISSTYKYRWGRWHTGIDIDGYALEGYPIVASDGGTVIMAEYYGGYGICVIIDHGGQRQTLYGHMSGVAVGYGDYVSQGQVIGYLGSTGNSTGTHCHFEIILNGSTVDPLPYLSGYELEPGAAD